MVGVRIACRQQHVAIAFEGQRIGAVIGLGEGTLGYPRWMPYSGWMRRRARSAFFSVDAGSRGVFDSCSAATVPWASSMITDVSFPTPCVDSNSLTSAEAAVESMALFAFRAPAMVPPDLAVAGLAKTGAVTGFKRQQSGGHVGDVGGAVPREQGDGGQCGNDDGQCSAMRSLGPPLRFTPLTA